MVNYRSPKSDSSSERAYYSDDDKMAEQTLPGSEMLLPQTNPTDTTAWLHHLLQAKLEIDADAIGEGKAQVWYCFSRLDGKAAARVYQHDGICF
ncbi:hypothetical protein V1509DRAFT_624434 [Lipomyces kononenkoae]